MDPKTGVLASTLHLLKCPQTDKIKLLLSQETPASEFHLIPNHLLSLDTGL